MLLELRVRDFGIIDEINWQPGRGLNVVTGETGAGKSLVVDAIDTLLSARADDSSVRHGADKAFIEVIFDISDQEPHSGLRPLLEENGLLETGENSLVITGEIKKQGRSSFRVSGKTVSRAMLKRIGGLLLDIHGQSQHLSLLNKDFHLDFLDGFAHTLELRGRFASKAAELVQTEEAIKAINEQEQEQSRQEEFLRFQIDELKRADLKEDEEDALEKQKTVLGSSEKLKEAAYQAYQAIYGDDNPSGASSALEKLAEAAGAMEKLAELDESLKDQLDYLREVESGLTDAAFDIRRYQDGIEYDPQQLQGIEVRLGLIRDLKRKYGQNIPEMLEYLAGAEEKLEAISNSEESRLRLEGEKEALRKELGGLGSELSEKRGRAAEDMTGRVSAELKELDMPQVIFKVNITSAEDEEGGIPLPDGKSYAFTKDGLDTVEFRASTNPGEPLKHLSVIASTGEISRFMLALKSALAGADNIPVMIFDEIDIGVGGRSGEVIGKKLWNLASQRQAVCITHLPQIAVFADSHYTVRKGADGERTTTTIDSLQGKARMKELAEMLSGPKHTAIAMENAGELVEKADAWKKSGA